LKLLKQEVVCEFLYAIHSVFQNSADYTEQRWFLAEMFSG